MPHYDALQEIKEIRDDALELRDVIDQEVKAMSRAVEQACRSLREVEAAANRAVENVRTLGAAQREGRAKDERLRAELQRAREFERLAYESLRVVPDIPPPVAKPEVPSRTAVSLEVLRRQFAAIDQQLRQSVAQARSWHLPGNRERWEVEATKILLYEEARSAAEERLKAEEKAAEEVPTPTPTERTAERRRETET
jgi:DNA repair exonuclease SbcCD ATPase subunit